MREEVHHFAPPAEEEKLPTVTESTGISYCDGSYRITRNKLNKFVFEYVVKGEGYIHSPIGDFTPSAGDVYILHQDASFTYGSSDYDPWEKVWFNARGRIISQLVECYGLGNVWHVPNCNLENLFRTERKNLLEHPEKAHHYIGVIIHRIVAAISENMAFDAPARGSREGEMLKSFIDLNMTEHLTLEEMAAHIHKSVSQTIRIFKRDWQTTPYDYILEKKIALAKISLTDTVKPIKEIAADLGFTDEYHFSNMFKQRTGIAPSEFRKQ